MKRFVATLFLALFAPSAWAQEAVCEPVEPARVENRDGSVLTVRTECPSPALRRHIVELACGLEAALQGGIDGVDSLGRLRRRPARSGR